MPPVSALIIRSTLTIFLFLKKKKKNAPTSGDAEIYIRMGMKKILVLILASGLGLPGPLSATPSSLSEGRFTEYASSALPCQISRRRRSHPSQCEVLFAVCSVLRVPKNY